MKKRWDIAKGELVDVNKLSDQELYAANKKDTLSYVKEINARYEGTERPKVVYVKQPVQKPVVKKPIIKKENIEIAKVVTPVREPLTTAPDPRTTKQIIQDLADLKLKQQQKWHDQKYGRGGITELKRPRKS
jgi:hypothetical protein|tara:strand:+ start:816 stop:1211 length:396 start_codon:yes stop_codon:yes gene_type:complete